MPTLVANTPVSLTLAAGEKLGIVSASGIYVVGPAVGSSRPTTNEQLDPSGTWIGPVNEATTVTIRPTTAGEYAVMPAPDVLYGPESVSYRSLVSGAWIGTWANRAQALENGGVTAFFTDIGVGGSYWDYVGGKWRPQARRVMLKNLVTAISNNAAPKTVMDYATIPAGLWQDGDLLEINVLKTREGGTSDTDATDLMIGSAPTTLGTTTGFSSSALATTTAQFAMEHRLRRESATSVRTLRVAGGGGGLGTSNSLTTLTTGLTNMDSNDVYVQITSDLTTAGGEVAWLRGFTVELISGS